MLDRTTWSPSRTITLAGRLPDQQKKSRLNNDRRAYITGVVVKILESGEPTRFAFEGTCRHAIRSRLCLLGWTWANADLTAARIVRTALIRSGARWPTWKEAQPEYTQDGHAPVERTFCVQCSRPLPEGHTKFCGRLCSNRYHRRLARLQELEDGAAYNAIVQHVSFWKHAR
jgi:hypothetical protein